MKLLNEDMMIAILAGLIPTILMLLFFFFVYGIIVLMKRKWEVERRRLPFTQLLLREPGESLREVIDGQTIDIASTSLAIAFMPVMILAVLLLGHGRQTIISAITGVIAGIFAIAYFTRSLIKTLNERRSCLLGLEGEVAVGQALTDLIRDGCWVFHDIPSDYGNIDHVVVGPWGVYAVETKTR